MRNLKRALSLALAAIMLIGMMALGTSAASVDGFTDADKITNLEAASVTTAIDIFAGYDDGSFGATDYVTRAQMATIICKILSGANVNADVFKGVEKFQDLGDAAWAEGFINMCYSMGIIAGTSDTTFDPNRPVKTWEASLMLQRALGWWATNDPANATIGELTVTSKGTVLGMYGDLTLLPTEYLTRNDVAEMVFHTIVDCVPVAYNESFALYRSNSSTNIFSGVIYDYRDSLAYTTFGLVYATGDTDAFGRPVITWGYGKLTGDNIDTDGSIKDSYTVSSLTASLLTVAETPLKEYTTTVTGRTLYNDLGLSADSFAVLAVDGREYAGNATYAALDIKRTDTNKDGLKADIDHDGAADIFITGNGVLTQVYNNPDFDSDHSPATNNCPYKVVITNTYIMDVSAVVEATNTQEAYVSVAERTNNKRADSGNYPYSPTNFDNTYTTDAFAKGDVVLITVALEDGDDAPSGANKYQIQSMELANSIQGEMTRYTETANTMAVNGVTYSFDFKSSQNANHYKANGGQVGDDVVVYLDNYGYAIDVRGITEEVQTNYALVLAIDTDTSSVFDNNNAWVKLLMMDGTVVEAKFTWNNTKVTAREQWDYDNLKNVGINAFGADEPNARQYIKSETKTTLFTNIQTLVTYSVNNSGVYTLYTLGSDGAKWGGLITDTNRSVATNKTNTAQQLFMNSATVLIIPSNKDKDQYTIYTGVRTMPNVDKADPADTNTDTGKPAPTMVAKENGTSLVNVIYTETGVSAAKAKDLIYIASKGEYVNDKDLGPYVNYTAVVNGRIVNLMVEGTVDTQGVVSTSLVKVGALYSGVYYNSDGIVESADLAVEKVTAADANDYWKKTGIIAANKDVIGIGGSADPASATYYTWSDDVLVAYIDLAGGKIVVTNPSITSLRTEDDSVVIYGVADDNAGEITWLYVISAAAIGENPIVTVGTSTTYTLPTAGSVLAKGHVVQISGETVVQTVVLADLANTPGTVDWAAAAAALSTDDWTVTVNTTAETLTVTTADSEVVQPTVEYVNMTATTKGTNPDAGEYKVTEGTNTIPDGAAATSATIEYNLSGKDFVTINGVTFSITDSDGTAVLTALNGKTTAAALTEAKADNWNVPTFDGTTSKLEVVKTTAEETTSTTDPLTVLCGSLADMDTAS